MLKITLIDDDGAVREVVEKLLVEISGCQVLTFADAGSALRAINAGSAFDLLITDLLLPGLNGAELIAELRRSGFNQPMAVLTGLVRCPPIAGATAVLHKPVRLNELEKILAEIK